MSTWQKLLLTLFLAVTLWVIAATWGSVGSAILTLALLLAGGYILLNHFQETHDPEDFNFQN